MQKIDVDYTPVVLCLYWLEIGIPGRRGYR